MNKNIVSQYFKIVESGESWVRFKFRNSPDDKWNIVLLFKSEIESLQNEMKENKDVEK